MPGTGKLPWFERGDFDMKTFLITVVSIGVLVGIALWALLAVRARQLLPRPQHREPHSQVVGPRSWRTWRRGRKGGLKRVLPSARGRLAALDQAKRWPHSGVA
jgi:hypothetical protein